MSTSTVEKSYQSEKKKKKLEENKLIKLFSRSIVSNYTMADKNIPTCTIIYLAPFILLELKKLTLFITSLYMIDLL